MRPHSIDLLGPTPAFLQHAAERDITSVIAPSGDQMLMAGGYSLGRSVLTSRQFSRSEAIKPHVPKFNDAQPSEHSIMSVDGHEHARLRRAVAGMFTTHQLANMAPFIERTADKYIEQMAAAGPPGDLITKIAATLPLAVLCKLLGIPLKDSSQFKELAAVLFDLSDDHKEKSHRRFELVQYMNKLIDNKRRRHDDDILTALIDVHNQGGLSKGELVTMGLALLMAGFETTVGQIGLTVLSILASPSVRRQLVERPGLISFAIEESLRLNPAAPVSFPRVALERVQSGNTTINAGETIFVSLLLGNRDEKVFPEPGRFILAARNFPHLTFGYGTHRCLGAPLARLQMTIVIRRLLQRFPSLCLANGSESVAWKEGHSTRGLSQLLVAW